MPEGEINNIIAHNINTELSRNDKSQADLANYMQVSQATVSNWCKGIKMPRMDKIDKICDFFHIKRSDLMEEKQAISPPYYLNDETRQIAQEVFENPELRSLFDAARDLPPERLRAHIDFINSLKAQEKGNNEGRNH